MVQNKYYHGVLLLDKPIGITSNAALQQVKHKFHANKVGHIGSLDPIASGMLALCFGEATKFSQFLLTADKHYHVIAKLGETTASGDSETAVITKREVKNLTAESVADVLTQFCGDILQIPPMYSAVKYQGQPLYKLARQGIEVTREPRKVNIYELKLLKLTGDLLELEIRCSKGTYVRTLVVDIGEVLGYGAHVVALRRLGIGNYRSWQMANLDDLQVLDKHLLPLETMVAHMPEEVVLTPEMIHYASLGQFLWLPSIVNVGWLKLKNKEGKFLGVGEHVGGGKVIPRKIVRDIR